MRRWSVCHYFHDHWDKRQHSLADVISQVLLKVLIWWSSQWDVDQFALLIIILIIIMMIIETRDSRVWPPLYHEPAIRRGRGGTSSITTSSNLIILILILILIMNMIVKIIWTLIIVIKVFLQSSFLKERQNEFWGVFPGLHKRPSSLSKKGPQVHLKIIGMAGKWKK